MPVGWPCINVRNASQAQVILSIVLCYRICVSSNLSHFISFRRSQIHYNLWRSQEIAPVNEVQSMHVFVSFVISLLLPFWPNWVRTKTFLVFWLCIRWRAHRMIDVAESQFEFHNIIYFSFVDSARASMRTSNRVESIVSILMDNLGEWK